MSPPKLQMDLVTNTGMLMHLRCLFICRVSPFRSDISFGRNYGTNNDHKVSSNQENGAKTLSIQRVEDFFANKDVQSSSPFSSGRADISAAEKNMQAQLQAFDQAFYANDSKHTSRK